MIWLLIFVMYFGIYIYVKRDGLIGWMSDRIRAIAEKNSIIFCISFFYSYLCSRMDELKGIEHSEIYIKNADNVWIGEGSQDAHSQR